MNHLVQKIANDEIERIAHHKNIDSVKLKSFVEVIYLLQNKDKRIFRGIVIAIDRKGPASSITVLHTNADPGLRLSYKFMFYSTNIIEVKTIRLCNKKPRRAKLFYLFNRFGKKAKI